MTSLVLRSFLRASAATANITHVGSSEPGIDLLSDRINLIAATTLVGIAYGVMATLYCMTTYFLFKKLLRRSARTGAHPRTLWRAKMERRMTLFYIIYTFVLFVLATLFTAGNSQNAIVAYVNNRLYPGGPSQYYITFMANQPVMVMTDTASLFILWLTDALILWRFIVFYYRDPRARWIIPFPCIMYIGVIIFSALVLQGEAGLGKIFFLSRNMLIAYYAFSFSLNVLTTVLIAGRLYWHKVQLERLFGPKIGSPYMSTATMLIESAALYGVWSFAFLVMCFTQNEGQTVLLATMSQVQVIAPLLIILWAARGKAWQNSPCYGRNANEDEAANGGGNTGVVDDLSTKRHTIGSQPWTCVASERVDVVRPSTGRGVLWSTVGEGGQNDGGDEEEEVNKIELGLCGSRRSSVVVHEAST